MLEPDLADPGDAPLARVHRARRSTPACGRCSASPSRSGEVRLGALNLYRDQPGPLTDDQHADALVMADVAAQAVLLMQANAPPGKLAAELEASADFQYVVHQASGMVAAQLDVSVGQALIRLRAYAFGNDRPLTEVAEDVVARTLRFDDRAGEKDRRRETGCARMCSQRRTSYR